MLGRRDGIVTRAGLDRGDFAARVSHDWTIEGVQGAGRRMATADQPTCSPHSSPPQAQNPGREALRTLGLVSLSAWLLLHEGLHERLCTESLVQALMKCLHFKAHAAQALAASALVHSRSMRVYVAVTEDIQALQCGDVEPAGISNLCGVACCMLRDLELAGKNEHARRLEVQIFSLLRDHSVDDSAVSRFASVLLVPLARDGPANAASYIATLAKLLDARKGLFGARFSRRSQEHQCAMLHLLLAEVLSRLAKSPQTSPPRLVGPQHSALLCGVVARGVLLAAEKCRGPGCRAKVAKQYARAADASLRAARSCSAFFDRTTVLHLDALLPPNSAVSPSSAFLQLTQASDSILKTLHGLQKFIVACRPFAHFVPGSSHASLVMSSQVRLRSCLVAISRVMPVLAADVAPVLERQVSDGHTALLFSVIYVGLNQAEMAAMAFEALESVLKCVAVLHAGALKTALASAATDAALRTIEHFKTAEPPWVSSVSLAAYYLSQKPGNADAVANWCSAEAAVAGTWAAAGERIRRLRADSSAAVPSSEPEVTSASSTNSTNTATRLQDRDVGVDSCSAVPLLVLSESSLLVVPHSRLHRGGPRVADCAAYSGIGLFRPLALAIAVVAVAVAVVLHHRRM